MSENHDLFNNKNKQVNVKFKIGTPKNIWMDEVTCLGSVVYSMAYSFKCKSDDEAKNKLKGVSKSQSKHIKFEEYKKSLDRKKYQKKCDVYILRSLNYEMYLQKVRKSDLFPLDDKRCFENNIESKPWNYYC